MLKPIIIDEKTPEVLICAYGTLRREQPNHYLLRNSEYIATLKTLPEFTLYGKNAGFPIAAKKGNTAITYELFKITNNSTLQSIHRLEGFSGIKDNPNNWYNVTEIETDYGTAYMYVQNNYNSERIITTGDWLNQN